MNKSLWTLALLSACGGGGGSKTEEGTPPTTTEVPVVADGEAPLRLSEPVVAPTPSPVVEAPSRPLAIASSPIVEVEEVITGAVLYRAATTRGVPGNPDGTKWEGFNKDGTQAYLYQNVNMDIGRYHFFGTHAFDSSTILIGDWFNNTIGELLNVSYEDCTLGPCVKDTYQMKGVSSWFREKEYNLSQILGSWEVNQHYAEMRIQEDEDSSLFMLCWEVSLPQLMEMWCNRFERSTGNHYGIYATKDKWIWK